jgi:predicted small secreted protein
MHRAKLVPLMAVLAALTLSACANTVRGVGADVRGTANAVEDQVKR